LHAFRRRRATPRPAAFVAGAGRALPLPAGKGTPHARCTAHRRSRCCPLPLRLCVPCNHRLGLFHSSLSAKCLRLLWRECVLAWDILWVLWRAYSLFSILSEGRVPSRATRCGTRVPRNAAALDAFTARCGALRYGADRCVLVCFADRRRRLVGGRACGPAASCFWCHGCRVAPCVA